MSQNFAYVSKCSKLEIEPFLLPSLVARTPEKFTFCCLRTFKGTCRHYISRYSQVVIFLVFSFHIKCLIESLRADLSVGSIL